MTTKEVCVHYWKLEAPNGNGGWVAGKCIKCKAEKDFNSIPEQKYNPWEHKTKTKERS